MPIKILSVLVEEYEYFGLFIPKIFKLKLTP